MMVKNIVGEDNAGENWAMLLEYGTQNREIIALQNMGLSRYSAQKIFKECRGAFISENGQLKKVDKHKVCLLYTSPSPRDRQKSRMPSSA